MIRLDALRPLNKQDGALFQYPTGTSFESALAALGKTLRGELVSLYVGRLRGKVPIHSTESALRDDLAGWPGMVAGYLQVTTTPKVPAELKAFSTFLVFDTIALSPSLKSVAIGVLFKQWARSIDKTEGVLTRQAFRGPSDQRGIDWWELSEFVAYVKVVRLCIVHRMLEALDPLLVWDKVDGDAGWWLSDQVKGLASVAAKHPLFAELEALQASNASLLTVAGLDKSLPARSTLDDLGRVAQRWRAGSGATPGTVRDLGTKRPWAFARIPPDGGGPADAAGPQFHAREAASARLSSIDELWSWRRSRLLTLRVLTGQNQYQFALIAGSLAHGGRHPPHETHRNGCMFDVDLTGLPDLIQEHGPADRRAIESSSPDGDDEELLEPDPPYGAEPVAATPRPEEWNFAPNKREREFRAAAVAFSECLYLTFPRSIIYASRFITGSAKVRLLRRLDMQLQRTPADNQQASDFINRVREAVARINPSPYDGMKAEAQTSSRRGHRNHWHVSYDPDDLGDENGIPSSHPDRAQELAALTAGDTLATLARALWELDPDSQ